MKLLYVILGLLIIGCTNNQTKIETENQYKSIDSIIEQSKINIITNDSINTESEKSVSRKVNQTVNKIDNLKEEVFTLKKEVEVAKMTVKTIYKIDTVYIETKKNFWGREKTTSSIKSDSSITVDSLDNH